VAVVHTFGLLGQISGITGLHGIMVTLEDY